MEGPERRSSSVPSGREAPRIGDHLGGDLADVCRRELQRYPAHEGVAREIERLIDHAHQLLAAAAGARQRLDDARVFGAAHGELGGGQHRRQWAAEIVSEDAREDLVRPLESGRVRDLVARALGCLFLVIAHGGVLVGTATRTERAP